MMTKNLFLLSGLIVNILFFTSAVQTSVWAAEVQGIQFVDEIAVAGKNLQLQGIGIRRKTFLKIKVYAAGLYLSKKVEDKTQESILNLEGPKFLRMVFIYQPSKEQMIDSWKEAFKNTFKDETAQFQSSIDELLEQMEDMKKHDELSFLFHDFNKVDITVKGVLKKTIHAPGFAKALLSIWFVNAEDTDLKDGLRGEKLEK